MQVFQALFNLRDHGWLRWLVKRLSESDKVMPLLLIPTTTSARQVLCSRDMLDFLDVDHSMSGFA